MLCQGHGNRDKHFVAKHEILLLLFFVDFWPTAKSCTLPKDTAETGFMHSKLAQSRCAFLSNFKFAMLAWVDSANLHD